jgi:peptidoglycan/xylan/chitin deacetylase (PgdA/CDA1 family)
MYSATLAVRMKEAKTMPSAPRPRGGRNQPWMSHCYAVYETAHDILSHTYDRVSAQDMCPQEHSRRLAESERTGSVPCSLTAGMAFAPQGASMTLE